MKKLLIRALRSLLATLEAPVSRDLSDLRTLDPDVQAAIVIAEFTKGHYKPR